MVKIKGGDGETNNIEMITTSLRYAILFTLLGVSFYYFKDINIQFIIFAVLLVVFILGSTFLIRDIMATTNLMGKISDVTTMVSITTNNSSFLKMSIGSIGIGIFLKIISLTFFLTVLNYGRKQLDTNEKDTTKKMTSSNSDLMNKYTLLFIISTAMIAVLLVIIFMSYTSVDIQTILRNISSLMLSFCIVLLSGFEFYYSMEFLKVKNNNELLYEITTNSTPIQ